MGNGTAQMPADFPTWYAAVSVGQPGAATARWPGVAQAVAGAKRADIEALIRIAFKTKQSPAADAADKFTKAIRAVDDTFDSTAAEREKQVLAASALMHLMTGTSAAAMAVYTAALAGARKPELPMDLVGAAENAIRSISESSRVRQKPTDVLAPDIKWSITAEEAQQKQPKDMVDGLRAVVQQGFKQSADRQNNAIQFLYSQLKLANEELQMLWWLTGGHTSVGLPFDKVDGKAKALLFGKELSDRTSQLPGPSSVRALLSRAGIKSTGKITIPEAVNSVSDEWIKSVIKEREVSPVTLPIHTALKRRSETGAGDAWVKNWAAVTEVAEGHSMTPLSISELFYREHLLLETQG